MIADVNRYGSYISKPIAEGSFVGELINGDPDFEFIEQQMMKVGSLAHGSVQWQEVEKKLVQLLSERTKDIKLLTYLQQCLHNNASPNRFIASIEIMTSFMSGFWDVSYPIPGPKGAVARRKFFNLMLQRLLLATDKVRFDSFNFQQRNSLSLAVADWLNVVEQLDLISNQVKSVADAIVHGVKRAESICTNEVDSDESLVQAHQITEPEEPILDVDKSSEKSMRQALLKMADLIADQEVDIPLSIRLRRYAIWGAINSPPDYRFDGETKLRGMNAERVKEYQNQLAQPTLNLWCSVENSLTLSPFWFHGQLMSFTIAQALKKPEWCRAIKEEALAFLQRMPELHDLKFKSGEPFVSTEVKAWLSSTSRVPSAIGEDWNKRREDLFIHAEQYGIASALELLDEELKLANEPRDKFYWHLLSADLLQANNCESIAQNHYQILYQQVLTKQVSDWEPHLLDRLEKHSTSE